MPPRRTSPAPLRVAARTLAVLTLGGLLGVVLVACGPGASPSATPQPSASPGATPTPVPGTASPSPRAGLPPQASVSWGRIWEGLPTGFPRFAGAEPTEVGGTEPTSATLDVPTSAGTPSEVMSFYRSSLQAAGYSVSVDGPLEDGAYTISAGGPAGCAAQVTVAPLGGSITVTILYGAACPFG